MKSEIKRTNYFDKINSGSPYFGNINSGSPPPAHPPALYVVKSSQRVLLLNVYFLGFQEELRKEFFDTNLPARLEKYSALLKSRNEGKDFFFGDKVRHRPHIK